MKKVFLTIVFIYFFSITLLSQGVCIGSQPSNGNKHYYVGTLHKTAATPHGKLKIEVFGGNVRNTNLGTTIFTISTRDGLRIHKETRSGSSDNYLLNVFETSTTYEFTVLIPSVWATLWIQSYYLSPSLNGIPESIVPLDIKEYDPSNKNNVTSSYEACVTMSTDQYGNIGIGSDSPQAKLDVNGNIKGNGLDINGTIRSKEVKIEATGWSDFVFNKDYQLPTLQAVEDHINDKGHLPDIPSEKEVLENGVNVVEMQAKLLQKIEELTLYVIDLKKENESIKQELEELKKE